MKKLGEITLILISFIYAVIAGGFVFLKFYNWFILPVFKTLPTITYTQAMGLLIFITCILKPLSTKNKDKDITKYYVELAIVPWLILALGYLVFLGINL
jgi:hypothetical protein